MINIYYSTDAKCFPQLVQSLVSLIRTTKEPLNIYNLTFELPEVRKTSKMISPEQTAFCDGLLKSVNKESSFTNIDTSDLFRRELYRGVNINNPYYPYFVTIRLLPDMIKELPDKILYLDTDVLFMDDVSKLYNIDVSDCEIAGRRDAWRITNYMNAGVLLLNLKKIRENGTFEIAREYCRTRKYLFYVDMTAVNQACKNKKIISSKFNSFKLKKDTVLFHACGVREGKIFLTKKWRHRIKPDEVDLFVPRVPRVKPIIDEYLTYVKNYPELFPTAILPADWENIKKELPTLKTEQK